jgi:5-(carboxyamino)imidazole ribonucleotide mutase
MPKGVPVATVAIDGSQNAALLVLQMIGITNTEIAERLRIYKEEMANR